MSDSISWLDTLGAVAWALTMWCAAALLALSAAACVEAWGVHTAAVLLAAVLLLTAFMLAGYAGCYIADRLLAIYGGEL